MQWFTLFEFGVLWSAQGDTLCYLKSMLLSKIRKYSQHQQHLFYMRMGWHCRRETQWKWTNKAVSHVDFLVLSYDAQRTRKGYVWTYGSFRGVHGYPGSILGFPSSVMHDGIHQTEFKSLRQNCIVFVIRIQKRLNMKKDFQTDGLV